MLEIPINTPPASTILARLLPVELFNEFNDVPYLEILDASKRVADPKSVTLELAG